LSFYLNGFIANCYFTNIHAVTGNHPLCNYVGCADVFKLEHTTPSNRATEAKSILYTTTQPFSEASMPTADKVLKSNVL